jgi:hypothetical protein
LIDSSAHTAKPSATSKRDVFCYYLLDGLSIEEAYEAVGFAPDSKNSWRYCRQRTVQVRLQALKDEIEEHVLTSASSIWDRDRLREFLQESAIEARAQGDYAPSNRAFLNWQLAYGGSVTHSDDADTRPRCVKFCFYFSSSNSDSLLVN